MIRKSVPLILVSLLLFTPSLWALELAPFQTRNLSPTALVHGLANAEPARQLAQGSSSVRLAYDLANNATLDGKDNEALLFDGQTTVVTLGLRYGVSDQLQLGIDLPYVKHEQGSFDNFISDWHAFFGLPNGDRDELANDQLTYFYRNGNQDQLTLLDNEEGLGDLRLLVAWQLKSSEQTAYAVQGWIKAPTGDADKLTGSNGWDLALAISAQHDFSLGSGRGAFWGGTGLTWLGDGDVLRKETEDWAVSGWLGAGWSPLHWLALKLQLDGHTALYDSNLVQLGKPAVILTVGGTLGLSEKTSLDIGVGEDLRVSASPDVTAHLSLVHRF